MVNLAEKKAPLHEMLAVTCLYNGKWDTDITKFGCTECARRADPPNGVWNCDSTIYKEGSACFLNCNKGYMPMGKTFMSCIFDEKLNDFDWSLPESEFACVKPIGFVIGGQGEDLRYLNEVEIFAPGFSCSNEAMAPFPLSVKWPSAGFTNGYSIVCGGAIEDYVDCSKGKEGMMQCDRNVDCVTTKGGSQWCTGPKVDHCYTYDPVFTKVNSEICQS